MDPGSSKLDAGIDGHTWGLYSDLYTYKRYPELKDLATCKETECWGVARTNICLVYAKYLLGSTP